VTSKKMREESLQGTENHNRGYSTYLVGVALAQEAPKPEDRGAYTWNLEKAWAVSGSIHRHRFSERVRDITVG